MMPSTRPKPVPLRFTPADEPPERPVSRAAGQYPAVRLRRTRVADWMRRLVAESRLSVDDLIWPVFVHEGPNARDPIASMPGIARLTVEALVDAVGEAAELGVGAVAVFPVIAPDRKSPDGEEAWRPDNLCNRAVQALKRALPNVGVICDVALDP
jgi:porphobilinogen synthase